MMPILLIQWIEAPFREEIGFDAFDAVESMGE